MASIDRAQLLRLCAQVRPALATADYIPALTHIQFFDGDITAYNDVNAISVHAEELGFFSACVPGELLIKVLSSLKGEQVALTLNGDKLLVTSGRSKINIPVLPTGKFPFELPAKFETEIVLHPDMFEAIGKCLISVGNDDKQPARMGVTLERSKTGHAAFYSTDGVTISRATTQAPVELPGDTPVILPTFLCEQMVAMRKVHRGAATMEFHPGALIVAFEKATLYSKTLIDVEAPDFEKVLRKHFNSDKLKVAPIPDAMDSAISRAQLVQQESGYKRTKMSCFWSGGKGSITLSSHGIGDADDDLEYTGPDFKTHSIDPVLLARGLKVCSHIAIEDMVTVLTNEDQSFMYVLAHHATEK